MARDFLSDQIRTKQIIGSGSQGSPKITVISDTEAPNNDGTIVSGVLDNVGDDVFLFVSGTIDGKANNTPDSVTLFGGDVVVSGTLYAENQVIEVIAEATGSLEVSGSIVHSDGINIGNAEDGTYTDGLFSDFTSSTLLGTAIDRFNEVLKALAPSPAPILDQLDIDSGSGFNAFLSFGPTNNLNSASPSYITVSNKADLTAKDVNDEYVSNNNRLGIFGSFTNKIGTLNEDVSSDTYTNGTINYPDNAFGEADIDTLCLIHNGVKTLHTVDLSSFASGQSTNANNSGFTLSVATDGVFSSGATFPTFKYRTGTWQVGAQDQVNGMNYIQISKRRYGNIIGFSETIQNKTYEIVSVNGTDFSIISNDIFSDTEYFPNGWDFSTNIPNVVGLKFTRNNVVIENNNVVGAGTVREIISETNTGFAEWVNDNDTDALSASNNSLVLSLSGSKHLSGVEYFTGGEATYSTDIANFYKYVYGITPVTFIETSTPVNILSLNSFNVPQIGASEDHTKVLQVSSTNNLTLPASQRIIDGQISVTSNITHPRKSILQSSTQASANQILIDNSSNTSTKTIENFDDEVYRMISTTYSLQTDIASQNYWDSTQTITSGNTGYSDGLLIHNGRLMSTKNTSLPNNGNFGTMQNGPTGNPDYSNGNILTAPKKYIRRFTNTTSNTVRDISYNILGEGIIKSHSASLERDTTKFKLYYKLPGSTAWLDSATDFSYNNVSSDGNGGKIGTFNDNIESNPTNYLTFGTAEIAPNESILVKIESNKTWQGVLENLSVSFGAVGTVLPSPDTDNIDVSDTGATGKLSFGSSLTKAGYTDVSSVGSSTSVDANEDYNITSFANNIRRGIFDGTQTIMGEINEDVSSQGNNYPANAWGSGKANVGELKIELNGTILNACTIDLTTFSSGNSLDSNNTGFTGVTSASVGLDNNGLPDYRYFYRTGSFQIDSSSQRNGWNYVRVLHDLDGGTTVYQTNYAEWVNSESTAITFSNITIDTGSFVQGNTAPNYLSGINYFTSAKSNISITSSNVYKNVYSNLNNAISFPTSSNASIESITVNGNGVVNGIVNSSSRSLPDLDVNIANAFDEDIDIEALYSYNINKSIPGSLQSATLACQINHPLRSNSLSSNQVSPSPLIYIVNDTETNLVEDFSAETYRLQEGSYNNQTDINSGSWDSTQSLVGVNAGHNTGLQFFDDKLVSPSIDFGNTANLVGPIDNEDYSIASGVRTFYRKIQNKELSSKFNFAITIQGSGTLIANSDTLGSNNDNFRMFIKLPVTTNSQSTGWLDFRLPFQTGQVSDNDGCRTGGDPNTMTNTLSQSGTEFEGTFGTQYAYSDASQNGDYVVIKIEADSSWTGNISNIEFEWR